MKRVKAVILAAGLGTRLRPLTDDMPKCLVPVGPGDAARPLLDYWLDLLGDAGVREALINTHAFRDPVRRYCDSRSSDGCRHLHEAYEPTLLGSAGTLAANATFADDASCVIIIYADNLSDADLSSLLAFHTSHEDPVTMMLFRAGAPSQCGIAELDDDRRIVSFVEKPREPASNLANAGVYVLDADAYREIARMNAFDLGHDVLPRFVGRMRGWEWTGYHRDIGTLDAYEQAQRDVPTLLAARGANAQGRRRAVFLDRDGTIIEHVHYLADPALVRILPGAPEALKRLRAAGYRTIVVSNQSVVGRGIASADQMVTVNRRMCDLLAKDGVVLDAIYTCTDVPASASRTDVERFDRKPGPGMLVRAAREHHLDLPRSWMVGDMISDVLAGHNAGCCGSILVETGQDDGAEHDLPAVSFDRSRDLAQAAQLILTRSKNRQKCPGTTAVAPRENAV